VSRLVYGVQPVREVLRAHGAAARGVWLLDSDSPKLFGLERLAKGMGVPVERAPRGELDRRTKGGMHQGAVTLAPELVVLDEAGLLERLSDQPDPVVLVLDGVMDPQNFGAAVRSAVALGAPYVVWPEHGSAPLTPATFRASAGAIEHATLVRARSLPPLLEELKTMGFHVVLLEASSEDALEKLDLMGPVAMIIGAEDRGAKPAVRKAASSRARLPMSGAIDSLNASVATALALYEISRQRRSSKTQ